MTHFPRKGDWVRWVTDALGREGQVVDSNWPSFTVRWLGVDTPQVFPLGYTYFEADASQTMQIIARPKQARREPPKASTPTGEAMTPGEAAKTLGITPKQLRMRLRAGTIKGDREGGRWVRVYL